jgi:hypothetical protein
MKKFLSAMVLVIFVIASCGRGAKDYSEAEYEPAFAGTAEVAEIPAQENPYEEIETAPAAYRSFTQVIHIHPDLPAIARLDMLRGGNPAWSDYIYEATITIHRECGELIQEITGIGIYPNMSMPFIWIDEENPYNFHFADYNGDGFLDMGLRMTPGGSMRNDPHYFWLWCVESAQFVRNHELEILSDFASVTLNEHGNISAHSRETSGHYYFEIFSFEGGELVHIGTEEHRPFNDNDGNFIKFAVRNTNHATGTETITSTTQIHESLPMFTFTQNFDGVYSSIVITDEHDNLIQEIHGIYIDLSPVFDNPIVQFDDYNFDGFLDMKILRDASGGLGFPWTSYYFWIWDSEISQFVINERLDEITRYTWHRIDYENRRIETGWHFNAGMHHFQNYFDYVDGDFIHVVEWEGEHFGRSGFGYYHGMRREIHNNLITGEVTVELYSMIHELTPNELEKKVQAIDDRVEWLGWHTFEPIQRGQNIRLWFHTHARNGEPDVEVSFTEYRLNDERVAKSAELNFLHDENTQILFWWAYNETGDLIFAQANHWTFTQGHHYLSSSHLIYFYRDAVIKFITSENDYEPVTEFDLQMINAIVHSLENAYW